MLLHMKENHSRKPKRTETKLHFEEKKLCFMTHTSLFKKCSIFNVLNVTDDDYLWGEFSDKKLPKDSAIQDDDE